jgi:hypothetical protein
VCGGDAGIFDGLQDLERGQDAEDAVEVIGLAAGRPPGRRMNRLPMASALASKPRAAAHPSTRRRASASSGVSA